MLWRPDPISVAPAYFHQCRAEQPNSFDEAGDGEPAVWQSHGYYWMLFTGRDFSEIRRLGLARSTDGVHWTKLPVVFSGTQAWDAKVICDPSVVVEGGEIRVWFGGGDAASPDENLHGQIGFSIFQSNNDPEMRFRFQYKMILKLGRV
jgi:hypothetical protein